MRFHLKFPAVCGVWLLLGGICLWGCDSPPAKQTKKEAAALDAQPESGAKTTGQFEIAPVGNPAEEYTSEPATESNATETKVVATKAKEEPENPQDLDDDGLPDDARVFDIPEGDNGVLLQFISEVPGRMLSAEDEEKGGLAILAAAERVLKNNPTEAQRREAAEAMFNWLQRLHALYTREADKVQLYWKLRLEDFKDTEDPQLAKLLAPYELLNKAIAWQSLRLDQRDEFLEKLPEFFENRPLDDVDLGTSTQLAEVVLKSGDRPAAIELYRRLADILQNSPQAAVAGEAQRLRGVAHRLESLGQEVTIAATRLGGEQLDWADYQGKVVLVDFWATWCGPCLAELPHIRKLFDTYHERGFDVIAVSVDDDEEELKKFVTENELPWTVTFSYLSDARGLRQPLAVNFGVMTVPTALLIDQEGRLISLEARGDELSEWLENLLGPPDVSSSTGELPAVKSDSKEPVETKPVVDEPKAAEEAKPAGEDKPPAVVPPPDKSVE